MLCRHSHIPQLLAQLLEFCLGVELRDGLNLPLNIHIWFACKEICKLLAECKVVTGLSLDLEALLSGHILGLLVYTASTVERLVVAEDKVARTGHTNIGLKAACTALVSGLECEHCVLVILKTAASVCEELDGWIILNLALCSSKICREYHSSKGCKHQKSFHFT